MGALATSKSTHISVVVPMTGFTLCAFFCYYVLFDERSSERSSLHLGKEDEDLEVEGPIGTSVAIVNVPDNAKEKLQDEQSDVKSS
jgi:hypothetical protein